MNGESPRIPSLPNSPAAGDGEQEEEGTQHDEDVPFGYTILGSEPLSTDDEGEANDDDDVDGSQRAMDVASSFSSSDSDDGSFENHCGIQYGHLAPVSNSI